jgi:acyl-CoA thioesterase
MAVALNMSLTYTAAPSPGARLIAEAREINETTKTALYEIKVLDDRERLIAVCQATVYRTGKPLPFLETADKQA